MGKKAKGVGIPIVPPLEKHTPISKRQLKAQRRQLKPPVEPCPQEEETPGPAHQRQHQPRPRVAPQLPSAALLVAAEMRCLDQPAETLPGLHPHARPTNAEPLTKEVVRSEALRRLRLRFAEIVRGLTLSAPVVSGAFERWHFGWLRARSDSNLDPLLPFCLAPVADAALSAELVAAGAAQDVADAAIAELRALANREADMAAAGNDPAEEGRSDGIIELQPASSDGQGQMSLWHVVLSGVGHNAPLKVSDEWLTKLRAMHLAHSPLPNCAATDKESRFRRDLVRLLLRYKAIGGSGFQAALGGGAFAVLRSCFGTSMECFASPLNARSWPFCSAFVDVDAPFGSLGSFLDLQPTEGAFEANPPFVPLLIADMCNHMQKLLKRAEASHKALLFAVVVGASAALRRHPAWTLMQKIAAGPFGQAQWLIPLHAHGYTEGHAHIVRGGPQEARRMSSCDTAVFIWASTAAAERWPATPDSEAALRAAMKATVPRKLHKATKANKLAHAEKRRNKSNSKKAPAT